MFATSWTELAHCQQTCHSLGGRLRHAWNAQMSCAGTFLPTACDRMHSHAGASAQQDDRLEPPQPRTRLSASTRCFIPRLASGSVRDCSSSAARSAAKSSVRAPLMSPTSSCSPAIRSRSRVACTRPSMLDQSCRARCVGAALKMSLQDSRFGEFRRFGKVSRRFDQNQTACRATH